MKRFTFVFTQFFIFIAFFATFVSPLMAATFDISGNARFGTNMFKNLDLLTSNSSGSTTSFLEHRLLLRPDVVVDDRFSVKSELILLSNNNATDLNGAPEGFGTALGSDRNQYSGNQNLYVRRAWLDWASDWGIFRFGRQPKSWGLGLLYHAGEDTFDDFGTSVDRVGFEALVGSLNLNFGYEKAFEGNINSDGDDAETYEISVQYSNPEDLFNVGLLYSRNIRSGSTIGDNSAHILSLFTQKRWADFQLGGEFVSITEANRDGRQGALAQIDYSPGNFGLGFDFAYASASNTDAFNFHPNYKPFLILFNQSLSASRETGSVRGGRTGESAVGSNVGSGYSGAGVLLGKTHISYGFSDKAYILGAEVGYATLAKKGDAPSKNLGIEVDLHLTQKWYENFRTVYAGGLLFPGKAFGSDPSAAWGIQVKGALDF